MCSLPGNPYDGHTLHAALQQMEILTQRQPKEVFVDLGYRGATPSWCQDLPPQTQTPHQYAA
jgi:IS5 family transposase